MKHALVFVVFAACVPPEMAPPPPPVNAAFFSLDCEARSLLGMSSSRQPVANSMRCAAHLGDRLGAPRSGSVTLWTEAGTFDRSKGDAANGLFEVEYSTGAPVPVDVEPELFSWTPPNDALHNGTLFAPTWLRPYEWNENPSTDAYFTLMFTLREPRRPDPLRAGITNNPRDNLVTMVAMVRGEEAFTDANANGTFDVGEEFVDQLEPFIDADDDGMRDATEEFFDTNGNGAWDGKNGVWDADTTIWTSHRILWTGVPDAADVTGQRPSVLTVHVPAMTCPMGSVDCLEAGPPANVRFYWADPWFNELTHAAPTDGCALALTPMGVLQLEGREAFERPFSLAEDVHAGRFGFLLLRDVRGGVSSPRRSPPIAFDGKLICQLTPAPRAAVQTIVLPVFDGTIE